MPLPPWRRPRDLLSPPSLLRDRLRDREDDDREEEEDDRDDDERWDDDDDDDDLERDRSGRSEGLLLDLSYPLSLGGILRSSKSPL